MGVWVDGTFLFGYISCSLLTAIGAVMLMSQIGVGDPRQGINYTLSSITAVVLGGTSLRGGRGTFIGTVLGAVLLTEVLNAVAFLGLTADLSVCIPGRAHRQRRAHLFNIPQAFGSLRSRENSKPVLDGRMERPGEEAKGRLT